MSASTDSTTFDNSLDTETSATYVLNTSNVISATSVLSTSSVSSVPEGCVTTQFFQFIPWDNEDNIVPKEVDNIFNLVFTGICLPLLFIVSFSTNIIDMIVFYKHGLEERINACLFTLSLVDLLSVFVAFAYGSDVMYMFIIGQAGSLGPSSRFIIRNFLIGLHGFSMSSQMVYSVIALERCLCVTRPLLVKDFMSTKTTVAMLWTIVLIVTGITVFVAGVQYSVLCVFDPRDNSLMYISYPSEHYFRHKFVFDVILSVDHGGILPTFSFTCVTVCTVLTAFKLCHCVYSAHSHQPVSLCAQCSQPSTCVTVCTVLTAIKLRELTHWREKVSSASSSVSSRDLAISRVIIGTSVLFLASLVPSIVMYTCLMIVPDLGVGGRYDNLAWVIRRFFQLGTAINSTFNFFVYYGFGSKFRETVRLISC